MAPGIKPVYYMYIFRAEFVKTQSCHFELSRMLTLAVLDVQNSIGVTILGKQFTFARR